jgi:amphi-Trp domain-containing protein
MEETPQLEDDSSEADAATETDAATDAGDATDAGRANDDTAGEGKRKHKGKIKFDSVMQRSEAVAYFTALVDGLRHGQLQFRHGEENLSLEPGEQVAVEVKASRKGDKEKVAFELEWKLASDKVHELQG